MATLHLTRPLPAHVPGTAPRLAQPVRLSATPVLPVRQPSAPVATERTLEILAPLVRYLPDWVTVFPRQVGDPIRPLPTGIRCALAVLLPRGDAQALTDLDDALRGYTG